jgi:hypothetical protein
MPLLDHFGPPLHTLRTWTSFFHMWACHLLDVLNEHLPEEYHGCLLIQVGGYPNLMTREPNERDRFESQVYVGDKDWTLPSRMCAVVKFVSPRDKADAASRRAFAEWCTKDLQEGRSLIVVDIVTTTKADMHADLCRVARLGIGEPESEFEMLAAAYRPVLGDDGRVAVWLEPLALGRPLPTLPLWIAEDLAVPADLEGSYNSACKALRIPRFP